jgi:hypothetical protein
MYSESAEDLRTQTQWAELWGAGYGDNGNNSDSEPENDVVVPGGAAGKRSLSRAIEVTGTLALQVRQFVFVCVCIHTCMHTYNTYMLIQSD